jgi:hypothetical protein
MPEAIQHEEFAEKMGPCHYRSDEGEEKLLIKHIAIMPFTSNYINQQTFNTIISAD